VSPDEGGLQGRKEVGFTLLSMNVSLVAVFVSILFMGGIVRNLFRSFPSPWRRRSSSRWWCR
jgi:multidrug efflux pump